MTFSAATPRARKVHWRQGCKGANVKSRFKRTLRDFLMSEPRFRCQGCQEVYERTRAGGKMVNQRQAENLGVPYAAIHDDSPRFVLNVCLRGARMTAVLDDADTIWIDAMPQRDLSRYLEGDLNSEQRAFTLYIAHGMMHGGFHQEAVEQEEGETE